MLESDQLMTMHAMNCTSDMCPGAAAVGRPIDPATGKPIPKRYYIELSMKADNGGSATSDNIKRPQVRCERHSVALKVNASS